VIAECPGCGETLTLDVEILSHALKGCDVMEWSQTMRIQPQTGREIRTDRYGLPYVDLDGHGDLMYVTPCCGASATISLDDGLMCCKKCWHEVDSVLGGMPQPGPFDPDAVADPFTTVSFRP